MIQCILFIMYVIPISYFRRFCFPSISYLFVVLIITGGILILGSILQLRDQLSPFPAPLDNGVLLQNGFFRFSRHPIYSGILISSFSYTLYSCSIYKIIISTGLLIVLNFKSFYEEKLLLKKYAEYKKYKKSVGRFFP
ncbi:methyltransferase family protein [Aquimarina sp. M1]